MTRVFSELSDLGRTEDIPIVVVYLANPSVELQTHPRPRLGKRHRAFPGRERRVPRHESQRLSNPPHRQPSQRASAPRLRGSDLRVSCAARSAAKGIGKMNNVASPSITDGSGWSTLSFTRPPSPGTLPAGASPKIWLGLPHWAMISLLSIAGSPSSRPSSSIVFGMIPIPPDRDAFRIRCHVGREYLPPRDPGHRVRGAEGAPHRIVKRVLPCRAQSGRPGLVAHAVRYPIQRQLPPRLLGRSLSSGIRLDHERGIHDHIVVAYLFFAPRLYSQAKRFHYVTPGDWLDHRFGSPTLSLIANSSSSSPSGTTCWRSSWPWVTSSRG